MNEKMYRCHYTFLIHKPSYFQELDHHYGNTSRDGAPVSVRASQDSQKNATKCTSRPGTNRLCQPTVANPASDGHSRVQGRCRPIIVLIDQRFWPAIDRTPSLAPSAHMCGGSRVSKYTFVLFLYLTNLPTAPYWIQIERNRGCHPRTMRRRRCLCRPIEHTIRGSSCLLQAS